MKNTIFLFLFFVNSISVWISYYYKESTSKKCMRIDVEDNYVLPKNLFMNMIIKCYEINNGRHHKVESRSINITFDWESVPCLPNFSVTRYCDRNRISQFIFELQHSLDNDIFEMFGFISHTPFIYRKTILPSATSKRLLYVDLSHDSQFSFLFQNLRRAFTPKSWPNGDECILLIDSQLLTSTKLVLSRTPDKIKKMFLDSKHLVLKLVQIQDIPEYLVDQFNLRYTVTRVPCDTDINKNFEIGFISAQNYNNSIINLQTHPFIENCSFLTYKLFYDAPRWLERMIYCPDLRLNPFNVKSQINLPRSIAVIGAISYTSEKYNCGFQFEGEFLTKHIFRNGSVDWTSFSIAMSNMKGGVTVFRKLENWEIEENFNYATDAKCIKIN